MLAMGPASKYDVHREQRKGGNQPDLRGQYAKKKEKIPTMGCPKAQPGPLAPTARTLSCSIR